MPGVNNNPIHTHAPSEKKEGSICNMQTALIIVGVVAAFFAATGSLNYYGEIDLNFVSTSASFYVMVGAGVAAIACFAIVIVRSCCNKRENVIPVVVDAQPIIPPPPSQPLSVTAPLTAAAVVAPPSDPVNPLFSAYPPGLNPAVMTPPPQPPLTVPPPNSVKDEKKGSSAKSDAKAKAVVVIESPKAPGIDVGVPNEAMQFLAESLQKSKNFKLELGDHVAFLSFTAEQKCVVCIQEKKAYKDRIKTQIISFAMEPDGRVLSIRIDDKPYTDTGGLEERGAWLRPFIHHFSAPLIETLREKLSEHTKGWNQAHKFCHADPHEVQYDAWCSRDGSINIQPSHIAMQPNNKDLNKLKVEFAHGQISKVTANGLILGKSPPLSQFGIFTKLAEEISAMPKANEMQELLKHLKANHKSKATHFSFKVFSEPFAIWYDEVNNRIEMQPLKDIGHTYNNKVSFGVLPDGQIKDGRFEGVAFTVKEGGKALLHTPFLKGQHGLWAAKAIETIEKARIEKEMQAKLADDQNIRLLQQLRTYLARQPQKKIVPDMSCWIPYEVSLTGETITFSSATEKLTVTFKPSCGFDFTGKLKEDFSSALKSVMRAVYENTSKYNLHSDTLYVDVLRSGLKADPEWHLGKLARRAQTLKVDQYRYGLSVTFLDENTLMSAPGIATDAGGPSKGFIDDLFTGLRKELKGLLHQNINSSLSMPKANSNGQLEQLGSALMFCHSSYGSKTVLTGRIFEPALFAAIKVIPDNELEADALSSDTEIKMAEAIFKAYSAAEYNTHKKRLELLKKGDKITGDELFQITRDELINIDGLPEKFKKNDFEINEAEVRKNENREELRRVLYYSVFENVWPIGQLSKQLPAIRSVAAGMKNACRPSYWASFKTQDHDAISLKIQGAENRNAVIDMIQDGSYGTEKEVTDKTTWLKNWLREIPDPEFREFLKLVTDSTALNTEKAIVVRGDSTRTIPLPFIHTCMFQIDVATKKTTMGKDNDKHDDHTEENFIKCVKLAIHMKKEQERLMLSSGGYTDS